MTLPEEYSIAHRTGMNWIGEEKYPDGLVPWCPEQPPAIGEPNRETGRLRSCWYCGSMHPADLAAAIRAGATAEWADWKYGWPHKAYIEGVPNPHAGMLESRAMCSNPPQDEIDAGKWIRVPSGFFSPATGERKYKWIEPGEPAAATTWGKFYTVHLMDATPEDRDTIERSLGLRFTFMPDGVVGWKPVNSDRR